jgi:hypothetical protein
MKESRYYPCGSSRNTMLSMDAALTILTSVVVSAVVSSLFNLTGQAFERRARRKELIFLKAVELAKSNREFIAMVADKTGQGAKIADYVVYAEMYYWLLKELHDKGSLPANWQQKTGKMMGDFFRTGDEGRSDRT